MCGPLVLAFSGAGKGVAGRLAYQGSRLLVYMVLGAIAGFMGRSLALFGIERWVSIAAAGAIVIGLFMNRYFGAGGSWWSRHLLHFRLQYLPTLRPGSLMASSVYGAINGLLPCGLVYVACAAAGTTAGPVSGAVYLLCFGLGTAPILLGLSLSRGLSQRAIPMSLRLRLRALSPVSVLLVSVLLVLRGLALGIPYISPVGSGAGSCALCH